MFCLFTIIIDDKCGILLRIIDCMFVLDWKPRVVRFTRFVFNSFIHPMSSISNPTQTHEWFRWNFVFFFDFKFWCLQRLGERIGSWLSVCWVWRRSVPYTGAFTIYISSVFTRIGMKVVNEIVIQFAVLCKAPSVHDDIDVIAHASTWNYFPRWTPIWCHGSSQGCIRFTCADAWSSQGWL